MSYHCHKHVKHKQTCGNSLNNFKKHSLFTPFNKPHVRSWDCLTYIYLDPVTILADRDIMYGTACIVNLYAILLCFGVI